MRISQCRKHHRENRVYISKETLGYCNAHKQPVGCTSCLWKVPLQKQLTQSALHHSNWITSCHSEGNVHPNTRKVQHFHLQETHKWRTIASTWPSQITHRVLTTEWPPSQQLNRELPLKRHYKSIQEGSSTSTSRNLQTAGHHIAMAFATYTQCTPSQHLKSRAATLKAL